MRKPKKDLDEIIGCLFHSPGKLSLVFLKSLDVYLPIIIIMSNLVVNYLVGLVVQ